jgi:mRNA interferase RelE/StbE
MDAIERALKKFSEKERIWSKELVSKIASNDIQGLDIKKLKGWEDIFRVRRGDIRIIYRKVGERVFILEVGRRNEGTYK